MFSQVDWRKVATGGGVLLLHLLVLLALLSVTGVVRIGQNNEPREIELVLKNVRPPQNNPQPQPPEEIPRPYITMPSIPHTIDIAPPAPAQKPTEEKGDIHAVGRYLFNCSGAYYEQMSAKERQNCLLFKNRSKDQAPVLGDAKPSPFDQVIQERQAPVVPIVKQCDPSSINASLHVVPCTDFSGHHLLETVPGH